MAVKKHIANNAGNVVEHVTSTPNDMITSDAIASTSQTQTISNNQTDSIFEVFKQFLIEILNLPNAVKGIMLFSIIFLFIKYGRKSIVKLISYFGHNYIKNDYLRSFFDNKRMLRLAFFLIPLAVINYFAFGLNFFETQTITNNQSEKSTLLENIGYIANFTYITIWLSNFLSHSVEYLNQKERYKHKPLHSFAQIIFLIFSIVSIATIYAHYTNQSPKTLFTTLSVMSVAVFLTLKDVILGIVSTILIIANNIVNVGDWIKNEKYHADGKIIEINLITVKVLNFDKTIVTIPTYSLVSEGFINQQEILNSGLRRIKRSVRIEASSIKLINEEELEKYKNIKYMKDYIEHKSEQAQNTSVQLTNLGLFRKYLQKYIEDNPMIYSAKNASRKNKNKTLSLHKEENIIVRIIEGSKEGVGLEIYCFSNKSDWKEYEYIVATLLEHVYSSAIQFDIQINC